MKKRLWMILLGLALAAVFVAACGSTTGQNAGSGQSQNPMMTGAPGGMMSGTVGPGNMMNGTAAPGSGNMMGGTPGAQVPATGMDFDQMFINMMVPHHQGAVEMAKIAQQRAEHPEIKQMADAIISGQQEEITQMKNWKQQWYGSSDTPPMSAMPMLEAMPGMGSGGDTVGHTMNMQADVAQLKNAKEPFDLAFIDAMIPHHQSAVDAAKLALTQAKHPEIKQLAQKIIDAQKKEIDQMNAWRKAWYPDAAPAATPAATSAASSIFQEDALTERPVSVLRVANLAKSIFRLTECVLSPTSKSSVLPALDKLLGVTSTATAPCTSVRVISTPAGWPGNLSYFTLIGSFMPAS